MARIYSILDMKGLRHLRHSLRRKKRSLKRSMKRSGAMQVVALTALLMGALPLAHAAAEEAGITQLVMLEEAGCVYCREWDAVIGPIFPKTDEGRLAPLRRVDIHGKWPEDLAAVRSDVFTPTFILVHEGQEVGRIRGYPGEDFFWGLLAQMIRKLPDEAGDTAPRANEPSANEPSPGDDGPGGNTSG
jgi:hypothetical protein